MKAAWKGLPLLHRSTSWAGGPAWLILAELFLVIAIVGCGPAPVASQPTATPGPTAAVHTTAGPGNPLAGTEWQLVSLRGEALLEDTHVSIAFEEDAVEGFAGCNHYGGSGDSGGYTITPDGGVAIPVLARTAAACLEPQGVMEQEDAYLEALAGAEAYRIEGDRLLLQNTTGEIVLVFDVVQQFAMDPAELVATAWQLISLDGHPPLAGSLLTLAFHDEHRAGGYAGCRDYVSGYQADEAGLAFTSTAMMGKACASEDLQRQEGEYTTILGWTRRFRLEGDHLELHTMRGEVLAFESLPQAAQPDLEGSTWSLLGFVAANPAEGLDAPVPLPSDLLSGTDITATFADSQVSGTAGCNQYGGNYQADGATLAISDLFQTEMACLDPEGVMAQEQRYLDTLRQVSAAHVYGTRLWLETPDGAALVFAPGSQ